MSPNLDPDLKPHPLDPNPLDQDPDLLDLDPDPLAPALDQVLDQDHRHQRAQIPPKVALIQL